ncbi:MAG: DUF1295 domain-containing protein [bacterium]|nr:DUF1295 domain-containing protein [Gammaproteobacteria bacterium]HIL95920.1 DUF1295 domain-containing protein [Pseudomonadales bacterium]
MGLRKDYLWIGLSYLVAMLVAVFVFINTSAEISLVRILIADVAATIVVFGFSLSFRNSSFYDAYWSVAPIVIAVTLLIHSRDSNVVRQFMVTGLILVWGIRLTLNWAYGWQGLKHEDWRYIKLQRQTGIFWWPVSFLGVHLFPTVIVFIG